MRIGIDVSKIGDKDGIGRYTFHLVKALMEIDAVNEYKLFTLFHRPSVDDPSAVLGELPALALLRDMDLGHVLVLGVRRVQGAVGFSEQIGVYRS